ncbi:hypothetical protein ES705_08048 [subsurface metagenome]
MNPNKLVNMALSKLSLNYALYKNFLYKLTDYMIIEKRDIKGYGNF